MKHSDETDLFNDENVTEFIALSAEYCTFIENTSNFTKTDFIKKSLQLLSGLYFYGLRLPRLKDSQAPTPEKFVTEMDWNTIYEKVKTKLGYHNDYLDVYDPVSKEEGDVSVASLADNFADLYQDIKDFSTAYGIGNEEVMEGAIWELVYNFEEYWGIKILNALRALHRVFFSDEELEDEGEQQQDGSPLSRNWLYEEKRKQAKGDEE